MVVGVLLLRARRPGIRCQTVSLRDPALGLRIFRRHPKTLFANYWRDVGLLSALEIFMRIALYKFTVYLLIQAAMV